MAYRTYGKSVLNASFNDATIEAVWRKGTIVPGVDPVVRRKDSCGAWIDRNQYGVTIENGTGWEVDHIIPVSQGGSDDLSNLQPLQWQNNRTKSDSLVDQWTCTTAAATR